MRLPKPDRDAMRFKRIQGIDSQSLHLKKPKDLSPDEKAEVVRSLILSSMDAKAPLRVHVSHPTPEYMFYKAVFRDMMLDPDIPEDMRQRIYEYCSIASLDSTPSPELVEKLSLEVKGNG